jgi:undecaprenyl pyrophosphate phosphatase UppP
MINYISYIILVLVAIQQLLEPLIHEKINEFDVLMGVLGCVVIISIANEHIPL